jgi:hypothetical protein
MLVVQHCPVAVRHLEQLSQVYLALWTDDEDLETIAGRSGKQKKLVFVIPM